MNFYKFFLLKLILFVGQRTFLGRGIIRKKLVRIIEYMLFSNANQNLSNCKFICKILGVPFYFIFDKILDYKVYFCRSDRKEIFFLVRNLSDNTIFFDIGASMGIYTQFLAFNFNNIKSSKIISIEPDPINCDRIRMNLDLLKFKIPEIHDLVKIEQCALGEKKSLLYLNKNLGPANGMIIDSFLPGSIKVNVRTLSDIIDSNKITHITNLKIDVEGYEDKVLFPFFKNSKKNLFPKNIIIEHARKDLWKVNIIDYMLSIGYKEIYRNKANLILKFN
jgi:FkbM family methyltransferase